MAFVILLDGQMIFCRQYAELAQPLGVDVQAPRRLMHRFGVNILAFPAHKPVEKQPRGVGMRRICQDDDMAAAAGDVHPFLGRRQRRDRQTRFDERRVVVVTKSEHESDIAFGQNLRQNALIVVLAHTRCGAVDAACKVVTDNATFPGLIGPMINPIIPAALAVRDAAGDFVTNTAKESARRTAKGLASLSTILSEAVSAGRVKIVSGIYDLATGEVTYLD